MSRALKLISILEDFDRWKDLEHEREASAKKAEARARLLGYKGFDLADDKKKSHTDDTSLA